jgi:hypothetical protein
MLLRWVLTRDTEAVLAMVHDYGRLLVDGDTLTQRRPQTWDDVLRIYAIDESLPKEQRGPDAVAKTQLFVIPARLEIYSSLRCGGVTAWARPNGSGDIAEIVPIQWAGLRFRTLPGHDIAVPVDSEEIPLPLPRPLAAYLSGSVPAASLPTVWPDPLFLAEQAMRLWPPWSVVSCGSDALGPDAMERAIERESPDENAPEGARIHRTDYGGAHAHQGPMNKQDPATHRSRPTAALRDVQKWYEETYIPECQRAGTEPSEASDWSAARCRDRWSEGSRLWESWKAWAETNNERPGSRKGFAQAMQAHGYQPDKQGVRGYAGIELKPEPSRTDFNR